MNFIMGSESLCSFQTALKMLKELGVMSDKCYSPLPDGFLHSTLLCLLVWQTSTEPESIWLQLITTGSSPDLKHYSGCWTCLSVVSTSQTSIKTFSAGTERKRGRGKEWKRSKQPLTSLIIRSPRPRAMSPPSEWRMRVCQVQTTKRCCLTHPSSTCPLQWRWHHLNHLNPPQHDLWQVTRHSNAHTSMWDDCGTAYLAENTTRLTMWFIQNYSSAVLLHTERLPIVHCGPGN